MLETLRIKNIAIIEAEEIDFRAGLNIISGETGAGKSIVINAIALLLGSRASGDLIRAGADEALVEGVISIRDSAWVAERLEKLGLSPCGGDDRTELLVRRTISAAGKHRIYINGDLATLAMLEEVCEGLVDLCGQHEHQSLLKAAVQLSLVDRYGVSAESMEKYSGAHAGFAALRDRKSELLARVPDQGARGDYLRYQLAEIEGAELALGEDERLVEEKKLLQTAETRNRQARQALEALDGSESSGGATGGIRAAVHALKSLEQADETLKPARITLEAVLSEIEDSALAVSRYVDASYSDPDRISQVMERLARIAELRRKYSEPTLAGVIERGERLKAELVLIETLNGQLSAIEREIDQASETLATAGRALSAERREAARKFGKAVSCELEDLKMGDGELVVDVSLRNNLESWGPAGADDIVFSIRTNKGEAAKPLGKIASGGELSRVMLAIRRIVADRGGVGVYLFDEIDAGLGGQTAFQVGKKLKSVAGHNQVICITHLPQVAAFADHHLRVEKEMAGKGKEARTVTRVRALPASDGRVSELARMLAGPELSKKSLDNARELIETARKHGVSASQESGVLRSARSKKSGRSADQITNR